MNFADRLEYMKRTTAKISSAAFVNTGWSILVGRSPERVALYIGPPPSNTLRLATDEGGGTTDGVIMVSTGSGILLTVWDHGAIVHGPIYHRHSSTSGNIGYIEVFGPP